MIQRIQTLYIIIGTLLILASCIFLPYFQCDLYEKNIYLMNEWGGSLWIILFVLFSLLAILKFKNRKDQIYYINGNLIGVIALVLIIYILSFYPIWNNITYTINLIFIIGLFLGVIFFLLARRAIKKDEDEINSINRLR